MGSLGLHWNPSKSEKANNLSHSFLALIGSSITFSRARCWITRISDSITCKGLKCTSIASHTQCLQRQLSSSCITGTCIKSSFSFSSEIKIFPSSATLRKLCVLFCTGKGFGSNSHSCFEFPSWFSTTLFTTWKRIVSFVEGSGSLGMYRRAVWNLMSSVLITPRG